jgi:uncharacterized protein (TIGR00369 family)
METMEPTEFERLRDVLEEKIPFNKLMGLKLLEATRGEAKIRFDHRPDLIGNYNLGILHGGVISAALDVVGASAVLSHFIDEGPLLSIGTVDLRVDYLRPASGEHFICTGRVMRPGRILVSTRMELVNDEGLLNAIGTAIYRLSREQVFEKVNV